MQGSLVNTVNANCPSDGINGFKVRSSRSWFAVAFVLMNLFLLPCFLVRGSMLVSFGSIELHEVFTCLLFFNTLLYSISRQGFFGAISISLYFYFLFMISAILFDYFGISSIRYSTIHLYYPISGETLHTIFFICDCWMLAVLLSLTLLKWDRDNISVPNSPKLEEFATLIVLLIGPLAILMNMSNMFSFANSASAYTETYIEDSSTSILSLARILFRIAIPVYFASMPSGRFKKTCFIVIALFLVTSAFGASRAEALLPAGAALWYLVNCGYRFTFFKTLLLVVVVFIILALAVFIRGSAASWNIIEQIANDSVTFEMMANTLDFGYRISNPHYNLFFLSAWINPILRYFVCPAAFTAGRTVEYVMASFSLDHKIMYAIAPSAFEAGRGFGSSSGLEFYVFAGYIGVILLAFLYFLVISKILSRAKSHRLFIVLSYWWLYALFFSVRGTPLPNLFNLATSVILFILLTLVTSRGSHKKPKVEA